MPKMTRYFVAALLSLLALDVAACSAESDLGSRLDGGSPPDGPGRILPDAGDGRGNVDKDGVPRDGRVSAENDTCQPTNDAAPPRDANANNDAGAICRGTPFRQALVIAMPSAYTVAGFSFAPWYRELQEFDFATQQDPRRISHHASNDFTSGNLRIKDEERIYQPEERISAVARDKRISEVTWSTGTKEYVVRVGSDANLHDETFNLPTLGPSSVMTTLSRWVAGSTGREDGHLVRNGAEVYQKDELGSGNVWSVIANLAGSGTTNWEGLAATSEETSGAYILFTKARTTGGQSGIIEQRWPNALPGSAGPATVVVANADAAPFGVSDDGCELYASRKNGSTLEVVIFRR